MTPALAVAALLALTDPGATESYDVSFLALLKSLGNRRELATLPSPSYSLRESSSRDPASTTPGTPTWFANDDAGHFVRIEERDGRREGVLLDAPGPGAVVRIWSANPAGTLRLYLDDGTDPVLAAPMEELLGGRGAVPEPLAAERAGGHTLYLPIPYARRCKLTCDAPDGLYYEVDYRTYAPGTRVESFRASDVLGIRMTEIQVAQRAGAQPTELQKSIARAIKLWTAPGRQANEGLYTHAYELSPDDPKGTLTCTRPADARGSHAISELRFQVDAADREDALRKLVLRMSFDGEETVVCPLGDFFGSAPGLNPFETLFTTMTARGELQSRWIMPYRGSFTLALENHGAADVRVSGKVRLQPWSWGDSSLHFHASWRASGPLRTRPHFDWTHAAVEGQGVFVGDVLSVANPELAWWGEGDAKITVDGESTPSIFGTGTEDDYGYAWCSPELFSAPLHAQTRCDGPQNFGWTSLQRARVLDAIPFAKSLRYEREVWHWKDCAIELAATAFYYARPGAVDSTPPVTPERLRIAELAFEPPRLPGALEAEELEVVGTSADLAYESQLLEPVGETEAGEPGAWSGWRQLWVRASKPGDWIELELPVSEPGRRELSARVTSSDDYGTIRFSVDGGEPGPPIATHAAELRAPRTIALGSFELGERVRIRVESVAPDGIAAEPAQHYFGIDCFVFD